jgi:uncharacterized membrane protein
MRRDHDIDILKGLAVLAMSFVHVNIFFLGNQAPVLDLITKWGAISCFTTFLIIVGIIQGRFIGKGRKPKWSKTSRRTVFLYISYLIIALLSVYMSKGSVTLQNVGNILIFKEVPLLSEYLIMFIFISLLFQAGYMALKIISKTWILTLLISVAIFILGNVLYRADFSNDLWIKNVFVGGGDFNYFPILQYMPIYLLGLFLGRKNEFKYYLISFLVVLVLYLPMKLLGLGVWVRFPPSVYFLIQSLLIPLFVLFVLKGLKANVQFSPLEIYAKDSLLSLIILTVTTLLLATFFSPLFPVVGVWVVNLAVISLTGLILAAYLKLKEMV